MPDIIRPRGELRFNTINMTTDINKNRIFLSYTRKDSDKVNKLYQDLEYAGFKPWMDTTDILPGQNLIIPLMNQL